MSTHNVQNVLGKLLADLSDFACAHFVRFLRAGFWQICRKSFPGRKIFSAECWPENFPITKIFFLCAGKKFVQEFMSTMIFSSTMHKFSGEFPEKWENPEKGPFWGTPPWTPQKPPKTPQNPPRAGRLWASGTRLCIWPLHPIAQGGKSCRNMH